MNFDSKSENYTKKKNMERDWYFKKKKKSSNFLLNKIASLLDNPKSRNYAYSSAKMKMKEFLKKKIRDKQKTLLIAPCGTGNDYKYLKSFSQEIYGIDLSPIAIKRCPSQIKSKVEDILDSKFENSYFDIIASPLFFHHLLNIGFDQFLRKFYDMLKPGGYLIILEPSMYYPLNIITRPIKKIFNNPFGEVEDEDPFRPIFLINALKRTRFTEIETQAATFTHVIIPYHISKIINYLTQYFLKFRIIKNFSWLMIFGAKKPE